MAHRWLIIASLLALTLAGCGQAKYQAEYTLPRSGCTLAVALRDSHPFLAEYERELFFGASQGPRSRVEMFPDTGGYALGNLYRLNPTSYLIRTMGNDEYWIDLRRCEISARSMQEEVAPGAQFVGCFDFAADRSWRFLSASDRAERRIGELHD